MQTMIKPQAEIRGSMSWSNKRTWSLRTTNLVHSGQRWDMITGSRAVQGRRAWGTALDQNQGEDINDRNPRGGGNGLSDLLIAGIKQEMMAKCNVTLASNRRQMNSDPKVYAEDKNLIYTQMGEEKQSLSCFQIGRVADSSVERHQPKRKASEYQRFPCSGTVGNMETRQKSREAEEKHNSSVEDKSWKGKGIMEEDQQTEIWEIEDESEEELPRGEGKVRSFYQDRFAGEECQHMENDNPAPKETTVRRYGMRKRAMSPDKGADQSRKRGRGQGRRMQEKGENSGQDSKPVRQPRRTVNHRVRRAERAYQRNTNPAVRRVMQFLEEESLQDQSEDEMEDWEFLLHDPGHTRGRMSLFKQSLHIYWVMKRLMAKALEQVAKEMVELAKGDPDLRRELSYIRIRMANQEEKMNTILQLLKGNQQDAGREASPPPAMDNA